MRYWIYRKNTTGWVLIGNTHFREDAQAILANWHQGYIAADGDIIETKGEGPWTN